MRRAILAIASLTALARAEDSAPPIPPYDPANRDASAVRAGRFQGKVCLVTGATSGIGRDTVLHLAAEGCKVAFTGRRVEKGKDVEKLVKSKGGVAHFIRADVTNSADCDQMVQETVAKFGRLDAAFNNAGFFGEMGPLADLTDENWRKVLGTNVDGVFYSMRAEIRQFIKQGVHGTIVNCGSVVSRLAMPNAGAYSTSKAALLNMARAAALDYGTQGIRVNNILPGGVVSEMTSMMSSSDAMAKFFSSLHPGGRWVKPEEVSSAVAFLLSEDSGYISGESIEVSSGMTSGFIPPPLFLGGMAKAIAEGGSDVKMEL